MGEDAVNGGELIRVRGARAHNLRAVDLDIPKGRIVAFTGVSGSGKTSLAIDTLHAEGQRRFVEAMSGAARRAMGALPRPDFDLISGLPPTVGIGPTAPVDPRHTVGSAVEVVDLLSALFAHFGTARCPRCGRELPCATADEITAALQRLPEKSRLVLMAPIARGRTGGLGPLLAELGRQGFTRVRIDGAVVLIDEAPPVDARAAHDLDLVVDRLRPEGRERVAEAVQVALAAGEGRVVVAVAAPGAPPVESAWSDHPWCQEHDLALPTPTPAAFSPRSGACPACRGRGGSCAECGGTRLGPLSRLVFLGGHSFAGLLEATVAEAALWLASLPGNPASQPIQDECGRRLSALAQLGLGYLPLGRRLREVSDGEAGRVRLAARTAADLSGVLYVVDEPSVHLGPADVAAVAARLRALREAGNTVVVVDHCPDVVAIADRVVVFGPGAGGRGGRIVDRAPDPERPPPRPEGNGRTLVLGGARGRNLRGVDADFPFGSIAAVTGVSGSGKTSLVQHTVGRALARRLGRGGPDPLPHDALDGPCAGLVRLSRAPLGANARSCVATAAGLWTPIRALLAATREARLRGWGPDRFSFNRPGGRCEACEGAGVRRFALDLLPETAVPCEVCEGRRFDRSTRVVTWRGRDAASILDLDVDGAAEVFAGQPRLGEALRALSQAGLGYLRLGQGTGTLSGGECQRIRLAADLGRRASGTASLDGTVILADCPEAGLHPADTARIVLLLARLAERGALVIAETNDPIVISAAATEIRLGPGGGPFGGRRV